MSFDAANGALAANRLAEFLHHNSCRTPAQRILEKFGEVSAETQACYTGDVPLEFSGPPVSRLLPIRRLHFSLGTLFVGILLLALGHGAVFASVEGFVETFSGDGPYGSSDGSLQGFDNPDWSYGGDGQFVDGGYGVTNSPDDSHINSSSDQFFRSLAGRGSFTSRLEVRNIELSPGSSIFSSSLLQWIHYLNPSERGETNVLSMALYNSLLNTPPGYWEFSANASGLGDGVNVPIAESIAFEIVFQDADQPNVTFRYFSGVDEVDPAVVVGPVEY